MGVIRAGPHTGGPVKHGRGYIVLKWSPFISYSGEIFFVIPESSHQSIPELFVSNKYTQMFKYIIIIYINILYLFKYHKCLYITAGMDWARSVLVGPILTGKMDLGMNTNVYTEYMKSKYVRISIIRNI